MELIVGLGNPGARYRGTRHNIGAEVIDRLAEKKGLRLKKRWRARASMARMQIGDRFLTVAKPRSFMNLSGQAVAALLKRVGCAPEDLLVISDDVNLKLGAIRIRKRGSSGGHNGLESIIACIGTEDFARLRVGVGPGEGDRVRHVLGRFSSEEMRVVDRVVETAVDAVKEIVVSGVDAAMNRFNTQNK